MRSFVELDRLIGQVPATVVRRLGQVDFGRGTAQPLLILPVRGTGL